MLKSIDYVYAAIEAIGGADNANAASRGSISHNNKASRL